MDEVRHLIADDPDLSRNLALVRSITGFGEVSATILLAELPTLASHPLRGRNLGQLRPTSPILRPKHSLPSSVCPLVSIALAHLCTGQARSAALGRAACVARFVCAPSAPNGTTSRSPPFGRMSAAGKPPKVILIAVARKLLVYAHAVIRTQKAFDSSPNARSPA